MLSPFLPVDVGLYSRTGLATYSVKVFNQDQDQEESDQGCESELTAIFW